MKEPRLDEIARSLATLTAEPNRPLVGDLDNLLFTLENTARKVELVISAGAKGAEEVRKALYTLRIKLADELSMVSADVVTGIDQLIGADE